MNKVLEALKQLQSIDSEVYEIKRKKQKIEDRVNELNRIKEAIIEDLDEKKKKLVEAENWYSEKHRELEEDKKKIQEITKKLTGIKKNKEYLAIQKEIETIKKTNDKKDDEILKLLDAIDRFKAGISEQEKKLGEIDTEVAKAEKDVKKEIKKIEKKIEEKSSEKEKIEKEVPRRFLSHYKRVLDRRGGLAVVPVIDKHCSGCNMVVREQIINILMQNKRIEKCSYCSRFLFYPGDEAAS